MLPGGTECDRQNGGAPWMEDKREKQPGDRRRERALTYSLVVYLSALASGPIRLISSARICTNDTSGV